MKKYRNREETAKQIAFVKKAHEDGLTNKQIASMLNLTYAQFMGWQYNHQFEIFEHMRVKRSQRYMTDEEICNSFKNAIDQKEQVTILAQLNDIRRKDVIKILRDGGITV